MHSAITEQIRTIPAAPYRPARWGAGRVLALAGCAVGGTMIGLLVGTATVQPPHLELSPTPAAAPSPYSRRPLVAVPPAASTTSRAVPRAVTRVVVSTVTAPSPSTTPATSPATGGARPVRTPGQHTPASSPAVVVTPPPPASGTPTPPACRGGYIPWNEPMPDQPAGCREGLLIHCPRYVPTYTPCVSLGSQIVSTEPPSPAAPPAP